MPVAAAAATVSAAGLLAGGFFASHGCGEGGKLLGDFRGTAMRAFRPLPVGRTDEDFAVVFASVAMKFVNRHGQNYSAQSRIGKRKVCGQTLVVIYYE
jgi:hypothetical protein